jgi:hypothetical protein
MDMSGLFGFNYQILTAGISLLSQSIKKPSR